MKGLSSLTDIQDFLQDSMEFLEETLASEKLSRAALEHRTKLTIKLTDLMKKYCQPIDMYIDMTSDPTLRSFFRSDSSTSDSSKVDKDSCEPMEEFYDVPSSSVSPVDVDSAQSSTQERVMMWSSKFRHNSSESQDQCDTASKVVPDRKSRTLLSRFIKPTKNGNKVEETKPSDRRHLFMEQLLNDGHKTENYDHPSVEMAEEALFYDEALALSDQENNQQMYVNSPSSPVCDEQLYDNARHTYKNLIFNEKPREEEYDYVSNNKKHEETILQDDDATESQNNNDSDGISLRSVTSEYSSNVPNSQWNIPASEAKAQAIRYGIIKRRNGRKLLSAWRGCFAVLLPTQLLMYSNNGESKPRVIIDLTVPNIRVARILKQGMDTKLLKMQPFVLYHNDKPLYEMSTKNREETDGWLAALQSVIQQEIPADYPREKTPDENDNENQTEQMRRRGLLRLDAIQGRNLPSLPPDSKDSVQTQQMGKKSLKYSNLFKFGNRNSRENSPKLESCDNSSTDEIYQVLPSPTPSITPYSSMENVKSEIEEIYNSVEEIIQSEFDDSSPESPKENEPNESDPPRVFDLPVYDIPPPTVRPLSAISLQSDDGVENMEKTSSSFARQISLRRANLLGRTHKYSKTGESTVQADNIQAEEIVTKAEIYDVPVSNRRISYPQPVSQTEDCDTPVVDTSRPIDAPENVIQPTKIKKIAQYWQEKLEEVDNKVTSSKNLIFTQKSLLPSTEIRSVGRSFSRPGIHRPALTSLSELLCPNQTGVNLKPSKILPKPTKTEPEINATRLTNGCTRNGSFTRGIKAYQSNPLIKKEPPPRPPAPVRINALLKSTSPTSPQQSTNGIDNKQAPQHKNPVVTEGKTPRLPSPNSDQYKARWAYVAQSSLELSVNSGEVVKVVNKCGPCWMVESRNKKGLVPKEYLISLTFESVPMGQ